MKKHLSPKGVSPLMDDVIPCLSEARDGWEIPLRRIKAVKLTIKRGGNC